MFSFKAVYVIVLREFKRFFRQRGRLVVTIARPLLWLMIVGSGFATIITVPGDLDYRQFILPGIVGMTILFSSIFSTITVVWDREFGFLREMLVAPISRSTIVAGKLLGGTALSLFQGVVLIAFAPLFGLSVGLVQYAWMFFLMAIVSLSITALGLFIASFLKSLEGFNVIMNFVVLPMFFLSGALYPVKALPASLRRLTLLNPLSYGVDSFKHVLLGGGSAMVAEFPFALDILGLILFSVVMIVLASYSFGRRE
ncbi:MAG: ABC transporter permease [Thermodesulfobacteriota bacterium]